MVKWDECGKPKKRSWRAENAIDATATATASSATPEIATGRDRVQRRAMERRSAKKRVLQELESVQGVFFDDDKTS